MKTLLLLLLLPGCSVNYGVRHAVEDYDVVRFEYTTIGLDAEAGMDVGSPICERVSAWAGGEHDIAGDPYKIVSVGAGCSFSMH